MDEAEDEEEVVGSFEAEEEVAAPAPLLLPPLVLRARRSDVDDEPLEARLPNRPIQTRTARSQPRSCLRSLDRLVPPRAALLGRGDPKCDDDMRARRSFFFPFLLGADGLRVVYLVQVRYSTALRGLFAVLSDDSVLSDSVLSVFFRGADFWRRKVSHDRVSDGIEGS